MISSLQLGSILTRNGSETSKKLTQCKQYVFQLVYSPCFGQITHSLFTLANNIFSVCLFKPLPSHLLYVFFTNIRLIFVLGSKSSKTYLAELLGAWRRWRVWHWLRWFQVWQSFQETLRDNFVILLSRTIQSFSSNTMKTDHGFGILSLKEG